MASRPRRLETGWISRSGGARGLRAFALEESEPAVTGRRLPENAHPGTGQIRRRWCAPSGTFQIEEAVGSKQVGNHSGKLLGDPGSGKGWIEKDDVEPVHPATPACPGEEARGGLGADIYAGVQPRCIGGQRMSGPAVPLDEGNLGGAPGQGFEAERAAARIEIQAAGVGDHRSQPVEQGLPDPSQGGAQAGTVGKSQFPALPLTTDDAHFIVSHSPEGYTRVGEASNGNDSSRGEDNGDVGKRGLWGRLRSGLGRTREQLASGMGNLLLGEKEIDEAALEELETALLLTDVGMDTTRQIMDQLTARVRRRELNDTRALYEALAGLLEEVLAPFARPLVIPEGVRPFVIFFVGVNGVGKTTTIGKLARHLKHSGHSVLLAAGDTFRAAAVEQLSRWGEREGIAVVAQGQGSDSASVVYDAVQSASSRGIDVVLADTAGRLQAKTNLMEELKKVKRVVGRLQEGAPHEVLLVLDAGVGQNALGQVKEFDAAVGVTGLVLTKLDGTARAGVIFAIARVLSDSGRRIPVYYIGVGEGADDLRPFEPAPFVQALLPDEAR